jgi:hypothetical protein
MKLDKKQLLAILSVSCGMLFGSGIARATLYIVPESKATPPEPSVQEASQNAGAKPAGKRHSTKHADEPAAQSRSGSRSKNDQCADELAELSLGTTDHPASRCK